MRASVTVVLLIPRVNRADLFYMVCFCLKFWLHPPPDSNATHKIAFILKIVMVVLESLILFNRFPIYLLWLECTIIICMWLICFKQLNIIQNQRLRNRHCIFCLKKYKNNSLTSIDRIIGILVIHYRVICLSALFTIVSWKIKTAQIDRKVYLDILFL